MDNQTSRERGDTYIVKTSFNETRTIKDILIEIMLKNAEGDRKVI